MANIQFLAVEKAEATPYLSQSYVLNSDGVYEEVSVAQEMIVPHEYIGVIPRKCDCGADFIISTNRTMIKCSSPKCYIKIAWCATKLYRSLGIKGYGIETFKSIAISRKCASLLDVLDNPPLGSATLLKQGLLVPRTWATAIGMLGLPKLKDTAQKVFGGCNCIEDFMAAITVENGIMPYLKKRLGGDVASQTVFEVIRDNTPILTEVQNIFVIKPEASIKLLVSITGDITKSVDDNGHPLSQDGYIEYVNAKLADYSIQVGASKAFSQIIAVVADNPSNSEKYRQGQRRNILVTSDRLVPFIIRLNEERLKNEQCHE